MTQAETLSSFRRALATTTTGTPPAPRCWRPPSGWPPEEKEPSVQQFLLLVGGLRAMAEGEHGPARCSTPTCCGRCRSPATRRRSTLRALRLRPARTAVQPVAWAACSARPAGCPGSASPAAETVPARRAAGRRLAVAEAAEPRTAARRAAWSRRTCSGTSSAGSARCPTSSARVAVVREARRSTGARRRTPRAPGRRRSRATWCPGTSRSSWTATGAGPRSAACPARRATRRARLAVRRGRGRDRDRREGDLRLRLLDRELDAARPTRCASSWASTAT